MLGVRALEGGLHSTFSIQCLKRRKGRRLPKAKAFLSYLVGFALILLAFPVRAEKGDLTIGESVYKEICFACHGLKGDGKGPSWQNFVPRPQVFANPDYMSRMTDEYMFYVIKYGKLAVLKREIPDQNLPSLAMPAFGHLFEEEEIQELIRFERAFATGAPQSSQWKEIFVQACATCHGEGGRGDGQRAVSQPAPKRFVSEAQPPPADMTSPVLMARFPDDFIAALLKFGRIDATEKAGYQTMQPFGHVLSDEEIWSVIRYIRETFVNQAKK